MEDFNDHPFEIKWKKIKTNVHSLLAIISLTQVVSELAPLPAPANSLYPERAMSTETKTQTSTNENSFIYLTTFGVIALLLYVMYLIKRNRK